jgi:murein DD-endopeptidase MepM/ murein hydrolase activator NlpD
MNALGPASLLAGRFRAGAESLTATFQRLASTPSVMPTQGWLTSNFSSHRFHPLLGYARPHLGIDVRAPRGTAIEAPAAGTVISAKWEGGYGWAVEIDHGYGIVTRYAHTSKMLVKVGDHVQRGDVIALVGQTGLAEGPHLHYEVRVNGKPVDPLKFVLPTVLAD